MPASVLLQRLIWSISTATSHAIRQNCADGYLRWINDRIALIAGQPGIGSLRLPAFPDVRTFPVGSHLLFYRVLPDGSVELIRVLHGARDWQGLSEDELG